MLNVKTEPLTVLVIAITFIFVNVLVTKVIDY